MKDYKISWLQDLQRMSPRRIPKKSYFLFVDQKEEDVRVHHVSDCSGSTSSP